MAEDARRELIPLLHAVPHQRHPNVGHLHGRRVGVHDTPSEASVQSLVGPKELAVHLVLVARDNKKSEALIVGEEGHHFVEHLGTARLWRSFLLLAAHRLLELVVLVVLLGVFAVLVERVRLVEEDGAFEQPIELCAHVRAHLPGEFGRQFGSLDLARLANTQIEARRAVNLAEDVADSRLARAGLAQQRHVAVLPLHRRSVGPERDDVLVDKRLGARNGRVAHKLVECLFQHGEPHARILPLCLLVEPDHGVGARPEAPGNVLLQLQRRNQAPFRRLPVGVGVRFHERLELLVDLLHPPRPAVKPRVRELVKRHRRNQHNLVGRAQAVGKGCLARGNAQLVCVLLALFVNRPLLGEEVARRQELLALFVEKRLARLLQVFQRVHPPHIEAVLKVPRLYELLQENVICLGEVFRHCKFARRSLHCRAPCSPIVLKLVQTLTVLTVDHVSL